THGANEPAGPGTATGRAAPGRVSPSVHRVTHRPGAVADVTVTMALCPADRTILVSGTGARLLYVTLLTVVATVFPAVLRTTICGQPRSEHAVLETLRKTIFQARFAIPSSGSPAMALGTLMCRSAAWQGEGEATLATVAEVAEVAEVPAGAGGGPAARTTAATAAVIARRTAGALSALRAMGKG